MTNSLREKVKRVNKSDWSKAIRIRKFEKKGRQQSADENRFLVVIVTYYFKN